MKICLIGGKNVENRVDFTISSLLDPHLDFETNAVVGTFNLLEAVRKFSPESNIVYSSTNKVYGDLKHLKYEEESTRYISIDYPNGLDENL